MILGVPVGELLWLAAAIMVGGIVAGFLAGLFGIGGGVVVVPVLFEVFRLLGVPEAVHMQLCIGTSLAIMVPTNIRSYLTHRAKGAVLGDVVRQWTPLAVVGTAVGAGIATIAPEPGIQARFRDHGRDHCAEAICRDRTLGASPMISRATRWSEAYGFLVGLDGGADGRERRIAMHDGADAVRQADP